MTYDRKVVKLDPKETAKWHKTLFGPLPETRIVVPTSQNLALTWRYTTEKPGDDWFKADFDAKDWKNGQAGFGESTLGRSGRCAAACWAHESSAIQPSKHLAISSSIPIPRILEFLVIRNRMLLRARRFYFISQTSIIA